MTPANRLSVLFRLSIVACLALAALVPSLAFASAPSTIEPPYSETAGSVSLMPPTPLSSEEEAAVQADLAAFEAARQMGPEAVIAVGESLRGRARDIVQDEIVAAREQLASQVQTIVAEESVAADTFDEEAAAQAQAALNAANRARALAPLGTPTGDAPEGAAPDAIVAVPDAVVAAVAPTAMNRTVGNGCTYPSIAAAIAAANSGDRLLIEGGRTFTENLTISSKDLTLEGGYAGCNSGSTARTTINGNASGRVIYIYGGLNVTLKNLNLTNGRTSGNGAGVFVHKGTQLTGINLEIYGNESTALGGGVRLYGGTATFTNTNIYSNTATAGAGVYAELYDGVAPALNLNYYADISDNQALTSDGFGGGVYMRQGTVFVTDCSDLYSNDAIHGGGAYLVTSTLTIRGSCSEIQSNNATRNGGGIYVVDSTIYVFDEADLYNNDAGASGTGSGGGAYLDNSKLWGDKAVIRYNSAHSYGGGVYADNGSVLDMDLGGYSCNGPRCSQLSYNTASTVHGGGVYAEGNSEVDLRQVYVEHNTAYYGGGIYSIQGPVYLYNTVLARNDATAAVGDAIRLYTGSSLTGAHNTLAYNDASGASTGSAIDISAATVSLSNSIIWGHASSVSDAGQTITCSDIQGGYVGASNMNTVPHFVDSANSDFHLGDASPVIDRCSTGETRDFDNESRPATRVRSLTPYDMGADEALNYVRLPIVVRNY